MRVDHTGFIVGSQLVQSNGSGAFEAIGGEATANAGLHHMVIVQMKSTW